MLYYGHGSWVVLVFFGAMFAARAIGSRRPGQRTHQAPGRSFVGAPPPTDDAPASGPAEPPAAGRGGMGVTTFTGIAPGWLADPSGRHQQRYWSGSEWTDHVTDDGVPATDPPPAGLRP